MPERLPWEPDQPIQIVTTKDAQRLEQFSHILGQIKKYAPKTTEGIIWGEWQEKNGKKYMVSKHFDIDDRLIYQLNKIAFHRYCELRERPDLHAAADGILDCQRVEPISRERFNKLWQ